ncbi:MAG: putative tricarboxylic transport rane protein [Clostridia bacterium]|nr:putative tricarboxylic transport rane protein [Clostridia bacterium]
MNKSLARIIVVAGLMIFVFALAGCGGGLGSKGPAGKGAEKAPASAPTAKETFPSKSIQWIVPFSPGSGADIFARTLAKVTEKYIGQNFVCENKPGGSTAVGVSYVLSQPADGYSIFNNSSTLTFLIAAGQAPFTMDDLTGIARINGDPCMLVVNSKSQFKAAQDLVDYAKKNPGKLKMGGMGSGSTHHYVGTRFADLAGFKFTWIPYEGGKDSVVALLGGNIDAIIATTSNVQAQIQSGNLRGLAISMPERSQAYKDVPTFKELGYDVEFMLWRGVFTKKGVPEDRIAALESAFKKALEDPEWKQYMKKFRQESYWAGSKDFTEFCKKQVASAKEFFTKTGIGGKK